MSSPVYTQKYMINKASISFVIFSSLLLAACTAKNPIGTSNQAGNGSDTEQNQSMTMRDLLASGKNQKCIISVSSTDEEGIKTETNATLYVSGKKMAEEISVSSTDKNMPKTNMHMISDGSFMYTWNIDTKDQGLKMAISETEANDADTPDSANVQTGGVDMNEKYDMKCTPWIVDNSKFTIPADVKFTDLSEMMKNIPTMPANIPSVGK